MRAAGNTNVIGHCSFSTRSSPMMMNNSSSMMKRGLSQQSNSKFGQQSFENPWRWFAAAGVLGGMGAGAYLANHQKLEAEIVPVMSEQEQAVMELDDFKHPYDEESWYWKMYFRTKRFIFLFAVFVPCLTMGAISKLTGSETARSKFLEMLVNAFNSAGCGLQKFGQWLSMRPDMLPADMIAALSQLRQDIPAHDLEHTREMVRESFGLDIEEMFEDFCPEPVASGTVAQVHRARLRQEYAEKANIRGPDGELIREVAVKVRHPDVLAEVWCDIELIYTFINYTDFLTVPIKKDDFLFTLQKQVDFKFEAQNLLKFAKNFKTEVQSGDLRFPVVSVEMLSNCILMESWADGKSVSSIFSTVGENFRALEQEFEEGLAKVENEAEKLVDNFAEGVVEKKRALATTIFDMSIKMFLRDNLVHGDLHGGNVMFDKDGNVCTVLDAGLTTSLDQNVRKDFNEFLLSLCTGKVDNLVSHLLNFHVQVDPSQNASKFSGGHAHVAGESDDEREAARLALKEDVQQAVSRWVDSDRICAPDGGPISLGDLIGEVFFSLNRHGVCLRGDVASSIMTMSVMEGLIRSLDPEFDMVKESLPYFVKYGSSL